MKRMLIGFVLGVVACLSVGAAIYHPVKGVVVMVQPSAPNDNYANFKTVMENQEAIYNLIITRCGEH